MQQDSHLVRNSFQNFATSLFRTSNLHLSAPSLRSQTRESREAQTQSEAAESTETDVVTRRRSYQAHTKRPKARYFGIPRISNSYGIDQTDYEERFPKDVYGEEMGPNARVWRTYAEEAAKADTELVDGWRDTTDVLLVFAGLFSAVVTTFLVQTSLALQQDNSLIIAHLLEEQVAVQRAIAEGLSVSTVPASSLNTTSPFSASSSDLWINGLWFTSLSFSLSTALVAVLVKQWIQHYMSVVSGTPQEQVRIRQYRMMGLQKWKVPAIVGWLPVLLHIALLLFFLGTVIFLSALSAVIAYIVGAIAVLSYVSYFVSNLLPLLYSHCPYRSPLVRYLHSLRCLILSAYLSISNIIRPRSKPTFTLQTLEERDATVILEKADEIEAEALTWLYSASSRPVVANIVLEAISGLKGKFGGKSLLRSSGLVTRLNDLLTSFISLPKERVEMDRVERLYRAKSQLNPALEYQSKEELIFLQSLVSNIGSNEVRPAINAIYLAHNQFITRDNMSSRGVHAFDVQDFLYQHIRSDLRLLPLYWSKIFQRGIELASSSELGTLDWSYGFFLLEALPPSYHQQPPQWPESIVLCSFQEGLPVFSRLLVDYIHTMFCKDYLARPFHFSRLLHFDIMFEALEHCHREQHYPESFIVHLTSSFEYLFMPPSSPNVGDIPDSYLAHSDVIEAVRNIRDSLQSFIESPHFLEQATDISSYTRIKLVGLYTRLCTDFICLQTEFRTILPAPTCTPIMMEHLVQFLGQNTSDDGDPIFHSFGGLMRYLFGKAAPSAHNSFRDGKALRACLVLVLPDLTLSEESVLLNAHDGNSRARVQFRTNNSHAFILENYIEGLDLLSPWKLKTHLEYLLNPDMLLKLLQKLTVYRDERTGVCGVSRCDDDMARHILLKLWELSTAAPNSTFIEAEKVWKEVLRVVVGFAQDHGEFHYSRRWLYVPAFGTLRKLLDAVLGGSSCDVDDENFVGLHEYVSGADVHALPLGLSQLDGAYMLAPYTLLYVMEPRS